MIKDGEISLLPASTSGSSHSVSIVDKPHKPGRLEKIPKCKSIPAYSVESAAIKVGALGPDLHLPAGADVNISDKNGTTTLGYAAYYGQAQLIEMFVKAGADMNSASNKRMTALHLAAQAGHNQCIENLLYAGARINTKSSDGFTPLMQAILAGYAECVETLILAGANVNTVVTLNRYNDDIVKTKEAAMTTVSLYLVTGHSMSEIKQ